VGSILGLDSHPSYLMNTNKQFSTEASTMNTMNAHLTSHNYLSPNPNDVNMQNVPINRLANLLIYRLRNHLIFHL
jgi:hypothetical protein